MSTNQFDYRKGKRTEDALVELTGHVINNLDKGKGCVGIFLDLAKAFDTVSHEILLKKLDAVGVRGIVHSWFESYLKNRKQVLKIVTVEKKL